MDKCAYLVNSTPKYYYMLPLHFCLLRRYAAFLECGLFLATEVPDHPICKKVASDYGVTLIPLKEEEAGFLESRAAALEAIALTGKYIYVLPMQEDFLLDRAPDFGSLVEATMIIDAAKGIIASTRLMPCPGPKGPLLESRENWASIRKGSDEYGFSFQATLWSLDACCHWYRALCTKLEKEYPKATTSVDRRRHVEVRENFAENAEGQRFFWEFFGARKQVHIGWLRAGPWSNAVYLSPWPYRPTAIVQGRLEPWAEELGKREGMPLQIL